MIEKQLSDDYHNIFYSVEPSPNNDRYKLNYNDISINGKNNITVFLKVCSSLSMNNITFDSGQHPLLTIDNFSLYERFNYFSFETFIDFLVSFPKKESDTQYAGFISFINTNMTDDDIHIVQKVFELDNSKEVW